MEKLLIICGPTATGKTSLGVKLAKKYNGEIISADSRQVYRGMDIGTGKDILGAKWINSPPPRSRRQQARHLGGASELQIGYYEIDGVKVWLYDVVEPDYQFTVADYVKCANLVIKDIWKRKKLPILVGGTGFYIKALVDGIGTMGIPQDKKLRQELSNCQIVKLSNLLKKTDKEKWEKMNESDRKNPRRLIRAIEVARQIQTIVVPPVILGSLARQGDSRIRFWASPSTVSSGLSNRQNDEKNGLLMIGLCAPYKVLYQKIDKRVDQRVKKGVAEEIGELLKKGYNWENSAMGRTMGYREWQDYFIKTLKHENIKTKLKEKIIQKWKYAEHKYARRQMTWFKKALRQAQGYWVDISKNRWENEAVELVQKWYSGKEKCRKK